MRKLINESVVLPNLQGFILEADGDEISPEAQLSQTLGDIANSRNDLLDQKKEADASGNLIAAATIDIDIRIFDLNSQIVRLEADKAGIALQGV